MKRIVDNSAPFDTVSAPLQPTQDATSEQLHSDESKDMTGIYKLKNPIQNYDWGSYDAIAKLLGEPVPSPEPQAELWMGAHPKAPSQVLVDGEWLPLPDQIDLNPTGVLGEDVAKRFSDKLPFLFKVLSAGRALSIQAHPSLEQAREGFARENQLGIPVTAPNRNYRDENHKPEIICALTPFYALNGFRRLPEMLELLIQVGASELGPELDAIHRPAGRNRPRTVLHSDHDDGRSPATASGSGCGRLCCGARE